VAGQVVIADTPGYDFLALARPAVIDRVEPLTGPLSGGTLVVVTGSGFTGSADLYFVGYGADGSTTAGAPVDCLWRDSGGLL
jgi:hypothetical protein